MLQVHVAASQEGKYKTHRYSLRHRKANSTPVMLIHWDLTSYSFGDIHSIMKSLHPRSREPITSL